MCRIAENRGGRKRENLNEENLEALEKDKTFNKEEITCDDEIVLFDKSTKLKKDVDLKDIVMSDMTSLNAEDCARFYNLSESNGVGAILRTAPDSIDVYNTNNWMGGFAYAEFSALVEEVFGDK